MSAAVEESSTSGPGSWYPGERMVRLHASHSYGFVLPLICAFFVFTAAAPDDATWDQGVLVLIQSATLVVALWTSGLGRAAVRPSVLRRRGGRGRSRPDPERQTTRLLVRVRSWAIAQRPSLLGACS